MQADSRVEIRHTDINDNQALKNGGGVAYMMEATILSIIASKIHNNIAATSGGVILADDNCFLAITGSLVYNNSAQQWLGGVIICSSKGVHSEEISSIRIRDSTFDSNFANYTGGVFNIDYVSNLTVVRSRFINNLAKLGGGVFESGAISIIIEDVNFIQNEAMEGGAIRSLQSDIIFRGICNLANNSAITGGAIYAAESMLTFTHTIIVAEQNEAYARGGGLNIYCSKLLCEHNCTIKLLSNEARDKGGGISAINSIISITSEGNPNTESKIQFTRNRAYHGG